MCTNNVKHTFEDEHFRQIDGVAKGNPLGPLLGNVFMGYVENLAEDLIKKICQHKRYVDDIIIIGNKCESLVKRT